MLLVNNTFSSTSRYSVTDTQDTQTATQVETDTDSSSAVNTTLLKALVVKVASSDDTDILEEILAILSEFGLDTSNEDFSNSKLSVALEKLTKVNVTVTQSANMSELVVSQQQQVETTTLALEDVQSAIVTNRTKANFSLSQLAATEQKALQAVSSDDDDSDDSFNYADFLDSIATKIGTIKSDYVDFYADLMQKYTEMYQAYNDNVQTAAAEAVSAADDANSVKFDANKIMAAYSAFETAANNIDLGSVPNWDAMTTEQRDAMTATLEPAYKVDSTTGKISFNLDSFNAATDYPSGINEFDLGSGVSYVGTPTTAAYQAWLASFNSVGSTLQSNMQSFAQRYSQANSTFDNVNKVFSGSITSLTDSAKEIAKALG